MRFYVSLTLQEFDRLSEIAKIERRRPRDQAALLIARALGTEERQRPGDDRRSDQPAVPELTAVPK